ncbi:MAG TPA: chemotaxis protein CheC [Anaerolineae bacterium]|nr:chemotaxis protein CheC [Anaerolineae bacterium]
MKLNETQHDALTELINIAFGRTAAALSDLTHRRILIERPEVVVCPIAQVEEVLQGRVSERLVTVHQIFSGALSGTAVLAFDEEGARGLVNLLVGEGTPFPDLDISSQEVLMEVGNILLSTCLGILGNLLEVRLSFSIPRIHLSDLTAMLDSLSIQNEKRLHYAIIAYATFRVRGEAVTGVILITLGVPDLDRLLKAVERWQVSYEERSIDG